VLQRARVLDARPEVASGFTFPLFSFYQISR
jgi:hypothetical protein